MNQLEILLAGVKSNNAAIGGKVAELQTLLRNRDELIADGARLGLKKTVMQAMLFNVKLKLVTGGSEPVPLGDVLPVFDEEGAQDTLALKVGDRVLLANQSDPADETAASLDTFRAVGFDLSKVAE